MQLNNLLKYNTFSFITHRYSSENGDGNLHDIFICKIRIREIITETKFWLTDRIHSNIRR